MKERFTRKHIFSLLVCVSLFIAGIIGFQVAGYFSGPEPLVPKYFEGVLPCSYVIDTNSTHVFCYNGTTWKLEFSGTNASIVIQSAIDTGKGIFVKNGTYSLSGSLILRNETIIDGEGDSTVFKPLDNIIAFISPTNKQVYRCKLRNFQVYGFLQASGGSAIKGCFKACEFSGLYLNRIREYGIYLTGFGDDYPQISYENDIVYNRIIMNSTVGQAGIRIGDSASSPRASDNNVKDNMIYYGKQGILLYGAANWIIGNHVVSVGEYYSNSWYCIYVLNSNHIMDNYLDSPSRCGLAINIPESGSIFVKRNKFLKCGLGANNTYNTIDINVASGKQLGIIEILSNEFMYQAGNNKSKYIVNTGGTGSIGCLTFMDNYIVTTGVGTGVLNFGINPTIKIIKDNIGYYTEKSGVFSSISNGTYIAHGLSGVPNIVTITLSVKGYAWLGTSNSTHFQIYASVSMMSGSWYAEYKP